MRLRLDGTEEIVYGLRVGDEVFGPYASAASAKKAASKARITGEVIRITTRPTVESVVTYNGEGER